MTAPEITALRKELEDALMTAFADFQRITGLCVLDIRVETLTCQLVGDRNPKNITRGVSVVLESL